ncbi:hypothetical protein M8C13_02270 [Crossiella sp. SN42]|uniref:hypothetical protein n=1 Tax=Crossiella sp. SN42 TaxID=2944808 RepID=UPI00207D5819|nr:hypothetical protein [Crossiella sp. SN42]MCO1574582.1 hypothetical protein [Crossiella sp. SN42]
MNSTMTRLTRTALSALAVAGLGVGLLAAPAVASPEAGTAVRAGTEQQRANCFVRFNQTTVRWGPGDAHRFVTLVNAGQGLVYKGWSRATAPVSNELWYKGDLWGGWSNVWIKADKLVCD